MNENEPPMRCPGKNEMMPKPDTVSTWDKQENNLSMLLRHPVYRRHELTTGYCKELVKLSGGCQEKIPSWRTSKQENIDVWWVADWCVVVVKFL